MLEHVEGRVAEVKKNITFKQKTTEREKNCEFFTGKATPTGFCARHVVVGATLLAAVAVVVWLLTLVAAVAS